MAGPRLREDDLIWTAFSWVPLHARHVVAAEGFTDFGRRRERLRAFLTCYGSALTSSEVLTRLDTLLAQQIQLVQSTAASGDRTFQQMIDAGRTQALATARYELSSI